LQLHNPNVVNFSPETQPGTQTEQSAKIITVTSILFVGKELIFEVYSIKKAFFKWLIRQKTVGLKEKSKEIFASSFFITTTYPGPNRHAFKRF
jgi:hypothetical protein